MNFTKTVYDTLTYNIIGAAMAVHRELGPGYPEKIYQEALMLELAARDLPAQQEVTFAVAYRGQEVGTFRVDLIVDQAVIVELKAVETLNPVHQQQVISYLTASGRSIGLLLNFGTASLESKRLFPPRAVQTSAAFKQKQRTWYPQWIEQRGGIVQEPAEVYHASDQSVQSVDSIRPDIATMKPYTPIFPFEVVAARLGRHPEEIIKLDANENPYGPSPKVREALAHLDAIHIYPDPNSEALRAALADFTGLPVESLLAGAGADELLDLIMRLALQPGDAILNCPPTFGMYPFDAAINHARVISAPRSADFALDLDAIEAAVERERPKLAFITSPNNPDGSWVSDAELERLLALPLLVVLDEAYVEFAGRERSRIRQIPERDNLIVLRTFSKLAALAGLRVGYGAFPAALMPHLWKIKQPYNVSVAASTAAIAALDDLDWLTDKVERIRAERERFTGLLREIPYLEPYPSQSNFILCRVVDRNAAALKATLEQHGILIRYYRTPRLADHVRFTVGTPEQMERVIEVLKSL